MSSIKPNVLISCVGRRNYLVQQFSDALEGRGIVLATDLSSSAVALAEADIAITVPPVFEPGYIDAVLEICERHNVGVVVSVNDHELPILAANRQRFSDLGVEVVISSPEVISICFDKLKMFSKLKEIGIKVPETFINLDDVKSALENDRLQFPLILKPRQGSGSFGVFVVHDAEELDSVSALLQKMTKESLFDNYSEELKQSSIVIQQHVAGVEFGLDIINDLDGTHVATLVKRKLKMRSGETDKAVTVTDSELEGLGKALGRALGHIGNLDCDVIRSEDCLYVLDLNPRFGGGYPFSHLAGANLPAAILAWAQGEKVERKWLSVEPGVMSAKCDRLVHIDETKILTS